MDRDVKEIPTIFVIFGATGDLTARKVIPALFHLFTKSKLPNNFFIVAFSRRPWKDEDFRAHILKIIKKNKNIGYDLRKAKAFLAKSLYVQGNFENQKDFHKLAKVLSTIDASIKDSTVKLLYLAVPPKYYKILFKHIKSSGLAEASKIETDVRVLVEKPFGDNQKTARELDKLLGKLFKEEQIYRIDHYLAKEMVQNILIFRFSNNIFEQSFSNKYVEKIIVRLLEKRDVGGRGAFYDAIGALKDVGQNHLLQMLAVATMEAPADFTASSIRKKRGEVLSFLLPPTKSQIAKESFRAQYVGYKNSAGVAKGSFTETYFKLTGYLGNARWRGVPIIFESGKAIGHQVKEVTVIFKPTNLQGAKNKVVFSLEPNEEIRVELYAKKPGYSKDVVHKIFTLPHRPLSEKNQYTEEYEKLLMEVILGDQTLFVSTEEVSEMWRFIDPVITAWKNSLVPLHTYKSGSDEILKLSEGVGERKDKSKLEKVIGVVGLGKMGANLARQLTRKGWNVYGFNRTSEVTKEMEKEGTLPIYALEDFLKKLSKPRVIWLSLPAGEIVREHVEKLSKILEKKDVVIDGGNSFFEESIRNADILNKKGIEFVDVGISGGPGGALNGACLMIGGKKEVQETLLPLFIDLSISGGYEFFEGLGAGHFAKMVHNAIEYGMMQAIAKGFDVLKKSKYRYQLKDLARVYNHGSVIESRLIGWLEEAFEIYGDTLIKVSGKAGGGGTAGGELGKKKSEAIWTLEVAKKLGIPLKVIKESVKSREASQRKPSYQGKVVNALRNRFGGHGI